MSKKNRNRARKNPENNRRESGSVQGGTTGEVKYRPSTGITIPASALGPPRDEIEAASPAIQAMRRLHQGLPIVDPGALVPPDVRARAGITGPVRLGRTPLFAPPGSPSEYRTIEPGDIIHPPLVGMLDGEMAQDVAPPGKVIARAKHVHDPATPQEYRVEITTPPDIDPDTVPVRTKWTAGDVLDQHTQLTERLVRPNGQLLDFIRYFVTDSYAKNGERAQGMFYPVDLRPLAGSPHPDPGREVARRVSGMIGHGLSEAVTFQVTTDMVAVMRQLYAKTKESITYISQDEMPAPAGFAWLDTPWPIIDANYNACPIRAITWELESAWSNGTEHRPLAIPQKVPCVRLGMWTFMNDDVAYGRWAGQEHRARDTSAAIGELTLLHLALLPLGEQFAMPAHAKDIADSILGPLHMLWMFLGMEIVSTEPAQDIPRLIRKQAARTLKHNEVRVVILRKIRHTEHGGAVHPRDVDWSCRWVVQGHNRHIDSYEGKHHTAVRHARQGDKHDICAVCLGNGETVRITWVAPYIKGPDGAPLKAAGGVVNRLAR